MGPLGAVDHLRVRERSVFVIFFIERGSNSTPFLVVLRRMGTSRSFKCMFGIGKQRVYVHCTPEINERMNE